MSNFNVIGSIYYCGDYVNTDVMAPGRYDPIYKDDELARIALIDYEGTEPFVDPTQGKSRFRIIVAGKDFGCGSSRETAPMALAAAGVHVVVAPSFARIFFRNCINLGKIYPVVLSHQLSNRIHGQDGEFSLEGRTLRLGNSTFELPSLGDVEKILLAGGLSQFVRQQGGLL
jgi:3-isopropylmalate/(R)-2-methylmalate dehydratase small subunit